MYIVDIYTASMSVCIVYPSALKLVVFLKEDETKRFH